MNKQFVMGVLTILFAAFTVMPTFAEDASRPGSFRPGIRKFVKNEVNENKGNKKDIIQDIRNQFGGARLLNAVITGINGSVLTVTNNGKTYTVNTSSTTVYRRHFWGSSSISEMSVNDKVNIWGKWTDSSKTVVNATFIRDLSIMKRFGAFVGTISNLSGSIFTLNTVARGAQAVTLTGETVCANRKMQTINCSSDLQNGHRIRVKGMWDKTNNTITGVTQVKDYSLPPQATPTK